MRTTLTVTEEPTAEPVSIEQVKRHCRIDSNADDELLTGYLTAARVMAEGYLSRALLTQTLLWTMRPSSELPRDRLRLHGTLELPRAPVQSILSVTTLDEWGNATTISPASLPVTPAAVILGYVADLTLEPATLFIGPETVLSGGVRGLPDQAAAPASLDGRWLWRGRRCALDGDPGDYDDHGISLRASW